MGGTKKAWLNEVELGSFGAGEQEEAEELALLLSLVNGVGIWWAGNI